jgi:hypothetical protein
VTIDQRTEKVIVHTFVQKFFDQLHVVMEKLIFEKHVQLALSMLDINARQNVVTKY